MNQRQTIKAPGFYDNTYLHTCQICLRLVVFSLTQIQYMQIEHGGKGTSTNESVFDGLQKIIVCWFISFLTLQSNKFLQSEIKTGTIFSSLIFICITVIVDKKITSVSGVLCSPPQSAVEIKQFLQLGSIFSQNLQWKRKKANPRLFVN